MKRNTHLLAEETFDLLIVGGGITGAGVALDATLRGFRVALVDRGDFASSTSSASSKLVHGGLRYLEHGRLRLVYEALAERRRLLRNAPHLVRSLRFIIPFYRGTRMAGWQWRAGLTLYDALAGAGNLRRSRPLSAVEMRRQFPGLRANGLGGGAAYWDAQMDDARLCLEVVRTAALHGAVAANYVEAVGLERSDGHGYQVRLADRLGGGAQTLRARLVVNAAGPWVDHVCRLAGDGGGPRLTPTKGVHLVAPGRGLEAAFLLLHPGDGRVFFVIPWMGKTLVGTTDTLWQGEPEQATPTGEDLRYLLEGHNRYFEPELQEPDVLGMFAGLRPLVADRPGEPSSLSREFRIFSAPSGLLSVAGGKYTTYRAMAEAVVRAVESRLGPRLRCVTRDLRLDGAPAGPWEAFLANEPARLQKDLALDPEAARHLVRRYGRRAADVVPHLGHGPGGSEPVVAGEPDLRGEFSYQRVREMAVRPADFLLRRTRLGLFHPRLLGEPATVGLA